MTWYRPWASTRGSPRVRCPGSAPGLDEAVTALRARTLGHVPIHYPGRPTCGLAFPSKTSPSRTGLTSGGMVVRCQAVLVAARDLAAVVDDASLDSLAVCCSPMRMILRLRPRSATPSARGTGARARAQHPPPHRRRDRLPNPSRPAESAWSRPSLSWARGTRVMGFRGFGLSG
jgi:hypothetical protein